MPFDREIPNDALGYVEPDEEDEMPGEDDAGRTGDAGDGATGGPADETDSDLVERRKHHDRLDDSGGGERPIRLGHVVETDLGNAKLFRRYDADRNEFERTARVGGTARITTSDRQIAKVQLFGIDGQWRAGFERREHHHRTARGRRRNRRIECCRHSRPANDDARAVRKLVCNIVGVERGRAELRRAVAASFDKVAAEHTSAEVLRGQHVHQPHHAEPDDVDVVARCHATAPQRFDDARQRLDERAVRERDMRRQHERVAASWLPVRENIRPSRRGRFATRANPHTVRNRRARTQHI